MWQSDARLEVESQFAVSRTTRWGKLKLTALVFVSNGAGQRWLRCLIRARSSKLELANLHL